MCFMLRYFVEHTLMDLGKRTKYNEGKATHTHTHNSGKVLFSLRGKEKQKNDKKNAPKGQRDLKSVAVLLIDSLLGFLLLTLEESANPSQRFLRQN